mmetsp:Transcript_39357/g.116674  ORF Transcript_39357/g.116674 Transcript_39357/m.116674 type:complete len:272 (-) Transcript_39357:281-1096(-)
MADGPHPLVICGPSGVGKSVLIKKLREVFPDGFGFSVSSTTRGPRPGEEDGKDYHFTDMETMKKACEEGKFIEYAHVHGNMYGTSREAVEKVRSEGKVCILDIDVQGAKNIYDSQVWPNTRFIFINPPSREELERRLRGRGTETEEKIMMRLNNSLAEIDFSDKVEFFNHKFILDGLSGSNVPKEVWTLCGLLRQWYPQLKEAPGQAVMDEFSKADVSGNGVIPKASLMKVLQTVDDSFTEEQLTILLGPWGDSVDFNKFLLSIFSKGVSS